MLPCTHPGDLRHFSFPIRALQVGRGREFAAEFEQACEQRGLLFVLPPARLNSTSPSSEPTAPHTEEFYQVHP